jgi:RNA polymerase nonessential primary-like sigma factor
MIRIGIGMRPARKLFSMHIASAPRTQDLLELAQQCISLALQLDYLSNGAGHRQSGKPHAADTKLAVGLASGARSRDIVRQYLAEVATRKRLSSSEEYCLASSVRNGDERARRRLIEHQLGLVVLIARRYSNRGLPLLDLIEEGNIGLMIASDKFDPERGCRFSTYAKWWIRQSIELALMTQTGVIHVPVYVTRALKQRSKAAAARMSCPQASVSSEFNERGGRSILDGDANFLLHDVRDRTYLADKAQDNDSHALADSVDAIAAPEHEQPEWCLNVYRQRQQLEAALNQLKDTERLVLRSRFGLANGADRTLAHIARQLNLSSERVRQIQAEALSKLRVILQPTTDLESSGRS